MLAPLLKQQCVSYYVSEAVWVQLPIVDGVWKGDKHN